MNEARELIKFLSSPQEEIANIALENSLPYTQASSGNVELFQENDFAGARAIKRLSLKNSSEKAIITALVALINLSDNEAIRSDLASDSKAVAAYIKQIVATPKPSYTKYLCMLLSNISRQPETLDAVRGVLLAAAVVTLAKPANLADDDYDFLGFAFTEFARLDPLAIVKLIPHLFPQLVLGSLNRRKAIAATVKNCLFDTTTHGPLANDTPLIETIMICLKGPETLSDEDSEGLPPMVRGNLSREKQREANPEQQFTLLECLLLLSSSQEGRDALRAKNTYYIVRELHNASHDAQIVEASEKFVNMVMRGDPSERAHPSDSKKQKVSDGDDDDGITEVI